MNNKEIPCKNCITLSICIGKAKGSYFDYYYDENKETGEMDFMTWCILQLSKDCSILAKLLYLMSDTIKDQQIKYEKQEVIVDFLIQYIKGTDNEPRIAM